jgi:hypothetical protein
MVWVVAWWRSLPGQAILRLAPETLEPVLAQQVLSGVELRASWQSFLVQDPDPEWCTSWNRSAAAWHQENRAILRQAFSNTKVLDRYDPPANRFEVEMRDLRYVHVDRLGRLERIGGLVHRFEVAPDAVTEPMFDLLGPPQPLLSPEINQIFLVHGRDDGAKETVARALRQLTGNEPVILLEQVDGGATIIEKFERHAGAVAAAVVILSPDDVGGLAGINRLRPRSRQNVVYELGWFHGKLGRDRVIALLVDDVEEPSDIIGVLYIPVDQTGGWRYRLGRELRRIGLDVDLNNVRH